jgi:metal-responsive CopG/Arc/MetJ family transcriptional regulator
MGRIDIILPDDLEQEFRAEVAKELGMRRGNLTLAIQEAIRLWIDTRRKIRSEMAKKAWETRKAMKTDE